MKKRGWALSQIKGTQSMRMLFYVIDVKPVFGPDTDRRAVNDSLQLLNC